ESSSSITSSSDTEIAALKAEMAEINKNLMRLLQVNQQVKAVTSNCETCGGRYSFSDCPATVGNTQNVYAARAYQGIEGLKLGFGSLTGEAMGSMIGELTGSEFRVGDLVRTTREEEVVGIVGHGYAVPLRVVIPFRSSFGLVIVLLGRVPKPKDEANLRDWPRGMGQDHMGRSGRGHGYCSCVCVCAHESWVSVPLVTLRNVHIYSMDFDLLSFDGLGFDLLARLVLRL
nr:hypothetical protein [Tanacetum cinerariifolium]